MTGRLYAGTSGFAYPAWAPRFYPEGLRPDAFLAYYASRLPACELNNTFYQRPSVTRIRTWLAATPDGFRFAVKAQRGGSLRALLGDADAAVGWLTESLGEFGSRLGTVLFRVPEPRSRDDAALGRLLRAWPPSIPLTIEFRHPSWDVDEVHEALASAGVALCATDLPDRDAPPPLRLTGSFLYLRLRRHAYAEPEVEAWAARLAPFLAAGRDAFVFFRHDEDGEAPHAALALVAAVERRLATERVER